MTMNTIQRKAGRSGVSQEKLLESANAIAAEGSNVTVEAVIARAGGGSRKRVGDILAQRRLVLFGTMTVPPVPVSVAKALNDHFEFIRGEVVGQFKAAHSAAEADGEMFRRELEEAIETCGSLEQQLHEVTMEREQFRGRNLQLQDESAQTRGALAAAQSQAKETLTENVQLRAERDALLQKVMNLELDQAHYRRKIERLSEDGAKARQAEARACGELAGAFSRMSMSDRPQLPLPAQPTAVPPDDEDDDLASHITQVLG